MSALQPAFSRWVYCQLEQQSTPAKGQVLIAKCFNRKENKQAGPPRQLFPFQCVPCGSREAPAFPPAPWEKCGASALARVLSLATTAWVCPKAEAVGSSVHYRRSQ